MNDNMTFTQLAGAVVQLQQQIEQMNQRLDMIYGAVTRLAEAPTTWQPSAAGHPASERTKSSTSTAGMSFSAHTLLDPGSMLASLHQHAVNSGLAVTLDSVERLKADLPGAEATDNR